MKKLSNMVAMWFNKLEGLTCSSIDKLKLETERLKKQRDSVSDSFYLAKGKVKDIDESISKNDKKLAEAISLAKEIVYTNQADDLVLRAKSAVEFLESQKVILEDNRKVANSIVGNLEQQLNKINSAYDNAVQNYHMLKMKTDFAKDIKQISTTVGDIDTLNIEEVERDIRVQYNAATARIESQNKEDLLEEFSNRSSLDDFKKEILKK